MDFENEFTEAADYVQNNAVGGGNNVKIVDDKKLLELYGLYKAATIGPCKEPQPGIFNMKGRAKWSAWKQVSELSSNEAMKRYIEMVKLLFNWTPSLLNDNEDDSEENQSKSEGKTKISSVGFGNTVSSFAFPTETEEEEDDKDLHPVFSWAKDNDLTNLEKWAETTPNINIQDKNGLTPLHWAVDRGHESACKLLLNNGANPSSVDNDGSTPIEYAETCEYSNIVSLLTEYLNIK